MELNTQRKVVLGVQHTIAMFGATVLVPLLTGLDASVALLAAGIGTLIFHVLTKLMVPVFLGSSFAFIPPIVAALNDEGFSMSATVGGIAAAGVVYAIVSVIVRFIGSDKIKRLVPPVVAGPVIIIIGITLAPVAVDMSNANWWLAILTLLVTVAAAIFMKGLWKMLPILSGAVIGYVVGAIAGEVDFDGIADADWFGLPDFTFATFEWGAIVLIAPVAFVTMIEHVGDVITNGRVVGKDFFEEPGLDRTLMGDGAATFLAGLVGGPANTTYSENTGVLAVTKVYDPAVLRIGAIVAIILGIIPKVAAVLQSIPLSVLGGLSIVLFGMIAAVGLRTLVESQVEMHKSRNLIVVAVILVLGLGTSGLENLQIGGVAISGLALAAVVGVVLNLILPADDS
ncbi:MAG: uracil-xanthine permease family protein [bacterium]|nr:uracil-xanthine permease family protein [bacterium]MDE0130638.1 uracil-xanthine permease family protein [bacterium]MDE0500762.1 uracil-xanthine permease family protein [bacterium]